MSTLSISHTLVSFSVMSLAALWLSRLYLKGQKCSLLGSPRLIICSFPAPFISQSIVYYTVYRTCVHFFTAKCSSTMCISANVDVDVGVLFIFLFRTRPCRVRKGDMSIKRRECLARKKQSVAVSTTSVFVLWSWRVDRGGWSWWPCWLVDWGQWLLVDREERCLMKIKSSWVIYWALNRLNCTPPPPHSWLADHTSFPPMKE